MAASPRTIPASGTNGLRENWRSDLTAGFLVFLIALPLCIGISIASGFPPISGILSAIIGGLIVSRFNGSFLTINGPAAGMIVVILTAAQGLGNGDVNAGYKFTLAAIVISSLFQMLMGLLKAGRLNAYFPASVVHGMLAGIGIIIMAKQIHILLGVRPKSQDIIGTILEIPHSLANLNPEITLTGVTGLLILAAWTCVKDRRLKMIPAPLVVVLVGILYDHLFSLNSDHVYTFLGTEYSIGPNYLVTVPEHFAQSLAFPDFGKIGTWVFWSSVISITLVGSLETLLSATAVDKLDPYKRQSDLNRDLTAIGAGNFMAGMVGGLPMIAEIVRSSANINNGAKTGWSNFFHSLFLGLFVVVFPNLIHEVPLSSLAAILVYTGFRLASPKEFAKTMVIGKEQLVIFTTTILGVLTTDLLLGVLIGIAVKIGIHLSRGVPLNNLLKISFTLTHPSAGVHRIAIQGSAIFANFVGLKSELAEIPTGQTIIFDVNDASYIDHTVMEFIDQFKTDYIERGGHCEIHGLSGLSAVSAHPLAARRTLH